MSTTQETIKDLHHDASGVYEKLWGDMGVPSTREVGGKAITPAYNRGAFEHRIRASATDLEEKGVEDPTIYKGMAKNAIARARGADGISEEKFVEVQKQNIIDRNVAENSTPLVFDPEILDILKDSAPLAMDRLTRRGQEGYTAVYNRVDGREDPVGFVTEADSTRLQDLANDFNLNREDVDMTIYADVAEIADFSATAASHYMDLGELAIGARMAEYAQVHEQTVLYGDPTQNIGDGGPGDANAFDGLATWYDTVDKSGVGSEILEDIKGEIRDLLQGPYAVDPNDLEIWTSWSMYDTLENELTPRARHDENADTLNFGDYGLQIGGVSVFPSHNVEQHTYTNPDDETDTYEPGDEGDVFLVNTATAEFRELAPLSTFPLGTRGASDEVAMVEYGALIERSGGNFGKHLSAYAI